MYLDGHCHLPRVDYLIRLVALFEETGAACLCRPQPLDQWVNGAWSEAIAAARHTWCGHNPGSDIFAGRSGYTDPLSAGAAYERDTILALGGYDERFDACEDVEFNHRVSLAGISAYVHPDLTVHYLPRADLRGLFQQMVRYGRGRGRLAARPDTPIPWPLLAMTVAGCGTAACWVLGGLHSGLYGTGVVLCCWGVIVIAGSLQVRRSILFTARVAAALATIHCGLLFGFWRGLLDYPRFRLPRRPAF
jgi:hypothetical protein